MRPAAGLGLLLLLPLLLPLLELEAAVTPSISPPPPPPQCSAAAVVHGHNYLASTPEIAAVSVGSLAGCCTLAAARPGARFFVYTPGVAPPKCGPAPPTGGGCCHIKGGSLKANDTAAGYISGLLDRPVPPAPPPPPPPQPAPPGAKNVLVLMADDLRPNLGLSYNHSVMRTPALDRLATEALTFTRAYVQQTVCSPSRNSYMSGRRVQQTMTMNFIDDFRTGRADGRVGAALEHAPGGAWSTLPGYFLRHGYQVFGTGKTFHPSRPPNNDGGLSWTGYAQGEHFANQSCNGGRPVMPEIPPEQTWVGCNGWGVITGCDENDAEALLTQATLAQLANVTAAASDPAPRQAPSSPPPSPPRPFFLMMGHHRPHLPWEAPQRFFDLYPPAEQLPLAANRSLPVGAPPLAWKPFFNQTFVGDGVPPALQHIMRRAYYASVSYMDHNFGLVLDALERSPARDSTITVVFGDHGWHHGEHGEYEKKSLWENDCRVPLLIRVPWIPAAARGGRSAAIVELVDVMPSLIELSGLPLPAAAGPDGNLGGRSFAGMLRAGNLTRFKDYAFTVFPRCNCTYEQRWVQPVGVTGNGSCPDRYRTVATHESGWVANANMHACLYTPAKDFNWVGLSVRSVAFRYTWWVVWDGGSLRPDWGRTVADELYSHVGDAGIGDRMFDDWENENLAAAPVTSRHAAVIQDLRDVLRAHFVFER